MRLKVLSVVYIFIGSFICGVMLASIIPTRRVASWWELLATLAVVIGVAIAHVWPDASHD
jgi:hypothetical protein